MAKPGNKTMEDAVRPAGQQVFRRSVYMIGGYEPKSSDAFYARTERELKRFCETWGVSAEVLAKGDRENGRIANIRIATDHGGDRVETDWNFFVWNDIVLGDFAKPFWYRIPRYWLTFADYVLSGTFFRILFLAWRFALYFLYPAVMHLVFGLAGWLAGWLVAQMPVPGSLWMGWAAGVAVALGLWHTVGERYFVRHLGDLWSFSRNFICGYRKDAEAALDHLARLIVQRASEGIDEEILLVGHSTGGGLILDAAARALALIHGRDYVLPTDVQAVAKDVMSHRLVLGFDAVADNIAPSQVVERIVAMVPPPTPVWNQQQRDQSHTQHRHNPSYPS